MKYSSPLSVVTYSFRPWTIRPGARRMASASSAASPSEPSVEPSSPNQQLGSDVFFP